MACPIPILIPESTSRILLATTVIKIGLGTTHLPFHPTFKTTASKQRMVETISTQASGYSNYIFGADLNTTPNTKAARTLRQSGLLNAGPALKHPTWTTKPFSIGEWQYDELQWRLDYMLFKGSLKSITQRFSRHTFPTTYPSWLSLILMHKSA